MYCSLLPLLHEFIFFQILHRPHSKTPDCSTQYPHLLQSLTIYLAAPSFVPDVNCFLMTEKGNRKPNKLKNALINKVEQDEKETEKKDRFIKINAE